MSTRTKLTKAQTRKQNQEMSPNQENKTKARCQLGNKAMKIKVANMLRGKERKNRYAKLNRDR